MRKRTRFKAIIPLLFTTIMIIIFLIVMPIITMNKKLCTTSSEQLPFQNTENNNDTAEVINTVAVNSNTVKVYITETGEIEEIPIEDYICGVVANEMPANFENEALKAQAVAARTFLVSKKIKNCSIANGAEVCDSTHCQVYTSKDKRLQKWDTAVAEANWNKILQAVNDTAGQILTYNGELVLYPQYFSTSSGKTEDAQDVFSSDIPYLKSVSSTGEEIAPKYVSEKSISIINFVNIVNSSVENVNLSSSQVNNEFIKITRTDAGGAKEVEINGIVMKGVDFRTMIGLNSTNFTYSVDGSNIVFSCKGYGHGVGMSQWGANGMAKSGSSYEEILKHYYTGVEIGNIEYKN